MRGFMLVHNYIELGNFKGLVISESLINRKVFKVVDIDESMPTTFYILRKQQVTALINMIKLAANEHTNDDVRDVMQFCAILCLSKSKLINRRDA